MTKLLDTSSLASKTGSKVGKFEAAECIFEAGKPLAFDLINENQETGRFVIVGDYEIRGGGIILEPLYDAASVKEVTAEEREKRFGHKAALILVPNELFAAELEKNLFAIGAFVCYFPDLNISENPHEIRGLLKSGILIIIKSGGHDSENAENTANLGGMHLLEIKSSSVEAAVAELRETGILSL